MTLCSDTSTHEPAVKLFHHKLISQTFTSTYKVQIHELLLWLYDVFSFTTTLLHTHFEYKESPPGKQMHVAVSYSDYNVYKLEGIHLQSHNLGLLLRESLCQFHPISM